MGMILLVTASRSAPSTTVYTPLGLDVEVIDAVNRIHSGIRQLRETMRTDNDVANGYGDYPAPHRASFTDSSATSHYTINVDVKAASTIQRIHSNINQLREMTY